MNRYDLIFTDEASLDLERIADWYGNPSRGLDIKFRESV